MEFCSFGTPVSCFFGHLNYSASQTEMAVDLVNTLHEYTNVGDLHEVGV